jgi:hypothetical protein
LVAGGSDGEQDPDRTAAELKRRDGDAGQKLFKDRTNGRNGLTRDLWPDGERSSDLNGEHCGAGEPLHAGSVEIDDVRRRRRDTRKALRFGDDLLVQLKRRDLVEDVGDRERRVTDVGQLTRRTEVVLLVSVGIVTRLAAYGVDQLLPCGEVSVHCAPPETCRLGNRPHAGVAVVGQEPASRVDDLRPVQARIAALTTLRSVLPPVARHSRRRAQMEQSDSFSAQTCHMIFVCGFQFG